MRTRPVLASRAPRDRPPRRAVATVVIGGLVTATLLTLLVLPAIYSRFGGELRSEANGET